MALPLLPKHCKKCVSDAVRTRQWKLRNAVGVSKFKFTTPLRELAKLAREARGKFASVARKFGGMLAVAMDFSAHILPSQARTLLCGQHNQHLVLVQHEQQQDASIVTSSQGL